MEKEIVEKSKRFNIWITPNDVKKIKNAARKVGLSTSSFIKMVVISKINEDNKNEKE